MTTISAVSASTATEATQKTTQNVKSQLDGLGQDDFMTLLLAQLKNQDPLKPMEDKDFIAQLAQLNSVTQLTEMNKNIKELMTAQGLAQGSALIGQTVTGMAADGTAVTGLVSGLKMAGGKVMVEVSGQSIALDMIKSVQGSSGS
ncbi:MAG: flagellar hook capping FlgD N-terminal domain-containing protein [Anaerolineae bacterium]